MRPMIGTSMTATLPMRIMDQAISDAKRVPPTA